MEEMCTKGKDMCAYSMLRWTNVAGGWLAAI